MFTTFVLFFFIFYILKNKYKNNQTRLLRKLCWLVHKKSNLNEAKLVHIKVIDYVNKLQNANNVLT